MKLVLDTNVALDWLVFDDARFQLIARRIAAGEAEVITTAACAAEFLRVLAYPALKLSAEAQAAAAAAYAARSRQLPEKDAPRGLPVCRDADDQKFLILAASAGADWLLTYDRALLALARRVPAAVPLQIATPLQLLAKLSAST